MTDQGPVAAEWDGRPQPSSDLGVVAVLMASLMLVALLASGDLGRSGRSSEISDSAPGPTIAPTEVSSTTTEVPTAPDPVDTAPAVTTTTTTAIPLSELSPTDVATALAVSGFPEIEVEIDESTVTLRGTIPDEVSRRAVLNQVGMVPGVEQIIDELESG